MPRTPTPPAPPAAPPTPPAVPIARRAAPAATCPRCNCTVALTPDRLLAEHAYGAAADLRCNGSGSPA